jgi:hypothetical protein
MNLSSTAAVATPSRTRILIPILVGGGIAGTFDLISAFITFGWTVPQGVAGGLIGTQAFHGGAATWVLGVLLHYSIAYGAAAIYCLASWKLDFLREHFLVCGLFYGIAVHLVMNLIVLPLSAYHAMGPYQYSQLMQGLLVHMVLIGLPISASLRVFGKR